MAINKRKKIIDTSREDKPEAEKNELFPESLFDQEDKNAHQTNDITNTHHMSSENDTNTESASLSEFNDLLGDLLSADEIEAFFSEPSEKANSEIINLHDKPAHEDHDFDIIIKADNDVETETVEDSLIIVADENDVVVETETMTGSEVIVEADAMAEIAAMAETETMAEAEVITETEETSEESKEEKSEQATGDKVLSFDESLDSFTYEDTCSEKIPRTKKLDIIRLAILTICVCVFVYSSYILINNIKEKHKSDLIYSEINKGLDFSIPGITENDNDMVSLLANDSLGAQTPVMDEIIINGAAPIVTPNTHTAELALVRASLEHLKNINDDLYGYIMIPDTNISYPIAQHEYDNDYYLDRAYNGEHLVNGSIFADVSCDRDVMWNYNTVLFGHNVTSGSMFNHINMFFEKEFFDNTLIYLYTFDGIFIYKPFSIHETDYDSGYIATAFAETDHFVKFAEQMRDLSDIKSDATFTAESRMLTLSTCTNGLYTRRYALHAYLVESITE